MNWICVVDDVFVFVMFYANFVVGCFGVQINQAVDGMSNEREKLNSQIGDLQV